MNSITIDGYTVVVFLSLICLFVSLFIFRQSSLKEKIFLSYIVMNGVFEIVASLSVFLQVQNNLPGLHLYTLLQFSILTYFFSECLKDLEIDFKSRWTVAIGAAIIIANSLFVQDIFTYNSYSKSMVELYIISMCLFLLVLFIKDNKHDRSKMSASVSFVSALFLHSSVSVIIYLYVNKILALEETYRNIIWNLRLSINIISYIIIAVGLGQIIFRNHINKLNYLNRSTQ